MDIGNRRNLRDSGARESASHSRPARASPEQIVKSLGRARSGIAAAFCDGHGSYLLAMTALGVAATFLHHALKPERQYHEALAALINTTDEPFRGETHPVLSAGLLPDGASWDLCKDVKLLDQTDQIAEQFAAALAASVHERPPGSLRPCSDALAQCPRATESVGPAWTDDATRSTLTVPSTVADVVRADPRTVDLLLASRDLERYTQYIDQQFEAGTLQAIYFVGLSGALRIVPAWSHNELPAHRTFAGANYVYQTLSREAGACPSRGHMRTITLPYLDVVGIGLVRTLSQAIVVDGSVVGALNFDLAPPDGAMYKILHGAARLFDLQLVRFYDPGGIESCAAIQGCPDSLSSLSSGELADLTDEWRTPARRTTAAGASAVRMLGDGSYFGTIIERRSPQGRNAGWNTVVFGRMRRSPARDIASAVTLLVFAVIACGAIVRGVRKKAKRLDLTLIRGLPVGVLELDARGAIVGANDRAEEILGLELPSFGSPAGFDQVLFSDLIHTGQIVMLDDAGLLPGGHVAFSRYDKIDDQRRVGDSSSYYAITRTTNQIIRVSGSTFVSPQSLVHTFGTIDTYIDEAHRAAVQEALARSRLPGQPRDATVSS